MLASLVDILFALVSMEKLTATTGTHDPEGTFKLFNTHFNLHSTECFNVHKGFFQKLRLQLTCNGPNE